MDGFYFSETRYINSLMDYHAKKKYAIKPQKSFKDPNNKLSIYIHLLMMVVLFLIHKKIIRQSIL